MKLRALGLVALTTAAILGMQPAAAQYPDHAVPGIVPSPQRETFAERQKADLACWRMIDDTAIKVE